MTPENPMLHYDSAEFYQSAALDAAKAIRSHDHAALALILRSNPSVAKDRGMKNLPLLVWACSHDDPQAFEMLLKAGAPPDDFFLVQGSRMSILTLATGAQKEDYFNLLLTYKANPNGLPKSEPPLFTAFYSHKESRFNRLLDAGANINHADETGKTILMVVAISRDYQRALGLVERGANVQVEMSNGTNLRKIIERFPLSASTEQGVAQRKLQNLLK
jgi:uncharacterized protein